MLPPELLKEGERQMTICNACRYCEGYCAVFPALELRRNFTKADLTYLANLCFDCRDCYYACQYAPPHEFAMNVPKLMAQLRTETYREFSWPAIFSGLFRRNALAVSVVTLSALAIILLCVWLAKGPDILFGIHLGEGAFYRVVPFVAMTIPALIMALYGLAILLAGTLRFWRETQGRLSEVISLSALWRATKDAFGLTYMKGGGAGCNYGCSSPSEPPPSVSMPCHGGTEARRSPGLPLSWTTRSWMLFAVVDSNNRPVGLVSVRM